MVLKLVLLLVLFYFATRAVANIIGAVRGPSPLRRPEQPASRVDLSPSDGRRGDIEDAKWVDVE